MYNSRLPNANHVLLTHVGARVRHYRLMLGIIDSRWALLAHVGGRVGSARVFGYQHVGIDNAKSS